MGSCPPTPRARLRAPRLLLATEPADGVAWFWLEDVAGRPGAQWQAPDYARAAHDLATTQGAYAAGHPPVPTYAWLSRGWLAQWVRTTSGSWPQTLVHLDFWPNNLIAAPDGRTVAVDWSSVGIGALAQDLDQVSLDPVWMQVLPGADLDVLENAVLASYARGVRSAGHDATDTEIRRWYAAAAGVRYTSVLAGQADVAADPARVGAAEQRWGRPFAAIAGDRARVIARASALAEEALDQHHLD